MAEQNSDAYAKNKAWGEQKEREAANLLQQAYPEIFTRQTDITSQVVPQKDIKFLPPQPNLQLLHGANQQEKLMQILWHIATHFM